MQIDPSSIPVGSSSMVQVTIEFEDDEGDVERIEGRVSGPGVAPISLGPVFLDVEGDRSGTVLLQIMLMAPISNEYDLELYLVDAHDQRSNVGTATIEAL
jgi:hypothetical protein